MKIFLLLSISVILVFSYCSKKESSPASPIKVDLTKQEIKDDFINYYKSLSVALNNPNAKEIVKDSNKSDQQKGAGISQNDDVKHQLELAQAIEKKYGFSKLPLEERKKILTEVVREAGKEGIFLNPTYERRKSFEKTKSTTSRTATTSQTGTFLLTDCTDTWFARETTIGEVTLGMSLACTTAGISPFAFLCWASVGAYYYLASEENDNAWCSCLTEKIGYCAY